MMPDWVIVFLFGMFGAGVIIGYVVPSVVDRAVLSIKRWIREQRQD